MCDVQNFQGVLVNSRDLPDARLLHPWKLFYIDSVSLNVVSRGIVNNLAPSKRQAITWTSDDESSAHIGHNDGW